MSEETPREEIFGSPSKRGPAADRGVVQARIVAAARRSFAENGWSATTLRGVARAAGADPRSVGYYFADKTALLEACLQPPAEFLEGIARTVRTPLRQRGEAMMRFALRAWSDESSGEVIRSIVLIAAHHPLAQQRLQVIFRTSIIGAVAGSLDDDERLIRAGLVSSQMLGVGMAREIWKLEPLASMDEDDIVALVGPTLQRYLTGRLPRPRPEPE